VTQSRPAPRRGADGLSLKDGLDFAVHYGLRLLPTEACSDFGAFAARIRGPHAYPEEDRRAAANMARLRPDWDQAHIAAAGLRRWDNIGRLMTEYSVLHRLQREGRVEIVGARHMETAKLQGRGLVLLGLHLGNWEVCGVALQMLGLPPASFYEPQLRAARNILSKQARRRIGATLFPPTLTGVRQAMGHLNGGGAVALFGDESVGGQVRGPFFGRPPHTFGNHNYAIQLARATGALIVPGYVLRTEGCRFVAHCLPPIALEPEPQPGARRMEDIAMLNAIMEPLVLENLDQWYFLHDRIE
jgi:KDO2-lipid IV(A) lauroyltransferase